MSWCDKLASTPTVGLKLKAHFAPTDILLNALAPILDSATEAEAKNFTIEETSTPFSASITTNDGFRYQTDEARISVSFSHRLKPRFVSGAPPVMEMLSTPAPFTSLLTQVAERLVDATLLLPNIKSRPIVRVGVVSTTQVAEEDLPPGIKKLIEYMARPWGGGIEGFNLNLYSRLDKATNFTDRCRHVVVKSEDKNELLTLIFDWLRTFETGRDTTRQNLVEIIEEAKKYALKYYEDIAEGSRFDEVLLREPTNS